MPEYAVKDFIHDFLVNLDGLDEKQIRTAKEKLRASSEPIQKAAEKLGLASEEQIARALAKTLNIKYVDLNNVKIPPDAVRSLSESVCKKNDLIPILKVRDKIVVAMADPLNVKAIEQVEFLSQCQVEVVVSTPSQIQQALDRFYGVLDTIQELEKTVDLEEVLSPSEIEDLAAQHNTEVDEGPVSRIVQLLITQAHRQGASDIHLEPSESEFRIRVRVDGLLQKTASLDKRLKNAIISSIKIMANMDITETRIPQDGRIHVVVDNQPLDLRVSTLPTIDGEKVVMRILDKRSILLELEDLGFSHYDLERLKKIIAKPNGIVLVSGPTGSGKTTTLYAILQRIASVTHNITTLEDPIEYRLDNINQSQINVKAGLTFAKGLRAILRQDPDVIMVGEIRDRETAEIAIQAALTGHLVFSTIHTNDAPSSVTRLIDMGIEPFLVASALEGVLAQRLVRKLCPFCKKPTTPSEKILLWFGKPEKRDVTFFEPVGCRECNRSGYKGRLGLYELLVPTESMRSKIISYDPDLSLKQEAVKAGMRSLLEDGYEKVARGLTSVEEVMRVAKREDK